MPLPHPAAHRMRALRRQGREPLARAASTRPLQVDLAALPDAALITWLPPRLHELLRATPRLERVCRVSEGVGSRDEARFVRYEWEAPRDSA